MIMFEKIRFKYTPQVDERDCGLAALSMVFQAYNSEYSIASLRELAKTDLKGTTALGIVRAAQKCGFETQAIQGDMSLFDMKEIPYPFIAHVLTKDKFLHYYTVFENRPDYLIIGDPNPSVGLVKMSKEQFKEEWDGVAIFIAPAPEYQPEKKDKNNLISLVPLIFKQRTIIVQVMVASLLTTIISIVGSYYFQGLIDTYIPGGVVGTLGIVSIGLVVAYLFQGVFQFAEQYMLTVISQRLSIDIILGYIRHIFELPMSFFETRRTGEITSRFSDANQIINALASTIISLFLDMGILVTVGVILGLQNVRLFLLTLICIPVYAVIILAFVSSFNHLNQETMQANSMLNSSIIEDINGIESIKAVNAEKRSYEKVDREFVRYLKQSFKYSKLSISQDAMKSVLQLILNVIILWFGANLVIKNQITLGQLITYNALLTYFTNPIQSIIGLQTKIQSARVAHNRLNEVYLVDSEYKNDKNGLFSLEIQQLGLKAIEFKNIRFRYGFGRYALDDVTMTIKPGSKVALVGASGSGKSTLVKLLTRFFEPESGELTYGSEDIRVLDRRTLRATIMYVPQDPYIFTGTIQDNILLSNPEASQKQMMEALHNAEIADDISQMPLGLQTEITQDGGLSGGQQQRIAIARGLVANSPILILDESTSNLDIITERKIIDNLIALKDKTIIFVAHRLTIAEMADQVYVMEYGRIIQSGTDSELKKDVTGRYASFFNRREEQ
ncbi:peptide cleavage/export ABC transporter [Lactiplantibacillus paraplantarum]